MPGLFLEALASGFGLRLSRKASDSARLIVEKDENDDGGRKLMIGSTAATGRISIFARSPSHGVAIESRDPPFFFHPCRGLEISQHVPHGSRRGLSSDAAPQQFSSYSQVFKN